MHEHPSQALLDLRTLLTRLALDPTTAHASSLSGVTVIITGDIRHTRVARSNAMLLPRLGARVILCGPEPLLPADALGLCPAKALIEIERDFDRALATAAQATPAVMMLRIQKERLAGLELNLADYIDQLPAHAGPPRRPRPQRPRPPSRPHDPRPRDPGRGRRQRPIRHRGPGPPRPRHPHRTARPRPRSRSMTHKSSG